jgi:hypothetical protein
MVDAKDAPKRPTFYCDKCEKAFPSQLDLEEHIKIDHVAAASSA